MNILFCGDKNIQNGLLIKRHPNLEKDFAIYFVNTADGIKL